MYIRVSASISLAALLLHGAAAAQPAHSLEEDAAAFGAREAVVAPALSPDGNSVLYLTPRPGPATGAVISNLVTGKSQIVVDSDGDPEALKWCRYSSPERVVCRFGALTNQGGEIIGFGRLVAIDTDGGDVKLLGQSRSAYDAYARQFDGAVIDWLGGRDGSVLMSRVHIPEEGKLNTRIVRTKSGLGVERVDTRSLRASSIESPKDDAAGYMTDGRGNVRLMALAESTPQGYLSGRVAYKYRALGSSDWKDLVGYQQDEFSPLGIDAASNRLYALKKRNGRYALYSIMLGEAPGETLVAEHPSVDIDNIVRAGESQKVIGYTYADAARRIVYFDPAYQSLGKSLSKALPKLPIVNFVDSTPDGSKLLIFAGSDQDPGRYYLFDRAKKSLNEAMIARPRLEGRTLAQVKPVTIAAADGTKIPGYLTLPPEREGKQLGAVILPHGGPSARDEWGFDWIAQFLAARGYAVLQPQYRGSAGFGDAWLNENGFQNWRTSIGDITASARWLVSEGIADPNRLAIVGWSYGGYAALQSAATEPGLYKAVAAVAPVTDLQMLKEDFVNFTNGRFVARFVGSGPHVAEGSPLRNARAITAPVLLAHGDLDANVRSAHSVKMDAALKDAGRSSELLLFKGLDHQLEDSAARTEMLRRIGGLLERTIGR